MTGFERLKEICRVACHERKACQPGFEALLKAESVPEILAVWKLNWSDIYDSKFADIMAENIRDIYAELGDEFRRCGIYVNEDSDTGLVIISTPDAVIHVGGDAKAYVFTAAEVMATDNAQVYCRAEGSDITLSGHTYGNIKAGTVKVKDFSEAKGGGVFHTYNAARVMVTDGTVIDHGHRMIAVDGDTQVYSDAIRYIELGGHSHQYPLYEYNSNEQ